MQNQLEALIDKFGIFAVLDSLSAVANAKAVHVVTNWGDADLAEEWEKIVMILDAAASKVLDCSPAIAYREGE
jgi:hypothetical protein